MTRNDLSPVRKPPKKTIKSVQFDLFTAFLTNDEGAVSNAIELWDGIPKYFLIVNESKPLQLHEGLLYFKHPPRDWGLLPIIGVVDSHNFSVNFENQ